MSANRLLPWHWGLQVMVSTVAISLARVGAVGAAQPWTHPEPVRTKGWNWKTPPDQVQPASGKRSHVFYVGEPVVFRLGGAAVSCAVRGCWA